MKNKAQIDSTITWVPAFIIIVFAMFIFLYITSILAAEKVITINWNSISQRESNLYLDLNTQKTLFVFLNKKIELDSGGIKITDLLLNIDNLLNIKQSTTKEQKEFRGAGDSTDIGNLNEYKQQEKFKEIAMDFLKQVDNLKKIENPTYSTTELLIYRREIKSDTSLLSYKYSLTELDPSGFSWTDPFFGGQEEEHLRNYRFVLDEIELSQGGAIRLVEVSTTQQ